MSAVIVTTAARAATATPDISLKDLEKVLYCEAYIVIDPKAA